MTSFWIKVSIGVLAFIVAALAVSDLERVTPNNPAAPRPWLRRLTLWGYLNLACAVATLGLLAIDEYLTSTDKREAKRREEFLASSLTELQTRFTAAREALGANLLQIRELSRRNDYLIRSLDHSMQRAGLIRLGPDAFLENYYPLRFVDGDNVVPKRGDEIRWSFVCAGGEALPSLPTGTCAAVGYGRLMANGFPVDLMEKSGTATFFGTAANDGIMRYESPAVERGCRPTAEAMKKAFCELHITVMREARFEYEKLKSAGPSNTPESEIQGTQDACRRYEAIFNVSCDEAVDRLHSPR